MKDTEVNPQCCLYAMLPALHMIQHWEFTILSDCNAKSADTTFNTSVIFHAFVLATSSPLAQLRIL